jgi:tRNA A-37 threonylcarbamoyl transferase component Bud32
MSENPECPGEGILLDFVAQRLDESTTRQVHDHLTACPRCSDKVAWIQSNLLKEDKDELGGGSSSTRSLRSDAARALEGEDGRPLDEESFDASLLVPSSNQDALGRLGKYDVLGIVGHGGMGVVFKAFDEKLRRTVAIKVLNRQLASSAVARRRFIREARAAAGINHENVVTIYAVEEHRDCPFIVMEYVGGGSLREHIRKHRCLEPLEAIRLSKEIAAGLAAAHAQGVIHRDIKPSNVMLEEGAVRVKITDFGLARAATDNIDLTSRGVAVGTAAYMSPEQVGGGKLDLRTDLFSLGCVMYAMIAGYSPFRGKHSLEMARKVSEYEPPPLEKTHEHIPPAFSEIVSRLLKKDPGARFQSATEVAEVLNRYLAVLHQTATNEMSAVLRGHRLEGRARRRLLRWAVPLVAVVLMAALGWLLIRAFRNGGPRPPGAEITVAKSIDADAQSISEALSQAGPGSVIRVIDAETYEEALEISGEQFRGIRLEAEGEGATLAAPNDTTPVIQIRDVPDVVIRGFHIEGSHVGAIRIEGNVGGVTIENVRCRQPDGEGNEPGMVILANGETDQDGTIVIRDSVIDNPPMGQCLAIVGAGRAAQSVRVEGNRFFGRGVQVRLSEPGGTSLGKIVIERNIFVGSKDGIEAGEPEHRTLNGINLDLQNPESGRRIHINNNTFLNVKNWIGLVRSDTKQGGVTVCNNLILGSDAVEGTQGRIDEAATNWRFESNWWEPTPLAAEQAELWGPFATLKQPIDLIQRDDPNRPDFLLPPEGSELFTSGSKEGLPYIGARGPQTTGQR